MPTCNSVVVVVVVVVVSDRWIERNKYLFVVSHCDNRTNLIVGYWTETSQHEGVRGTQE